MRRRRRKGLTEPPFMLWGIENPEIATGGTPLSGEPQSLAIAVKETFTGDLHVTTRQMAVLRLVGVADAHLTARIPGRACPAIP